MSDLVPEIPYGWSLVHNGEFEDGERYGYWYPGMADRANKFTGVDPNEIQIGNSAWFEGGQPACQNIRRQIQMNSFGSANDGPYFIIKKVD